MSALIDRGTMPRIRCKYGLGPRAVLGSMTLWFILFCLASKVYSSSSLTAWGAGTFVSLPADYNDFGQSIVPANLTNVVEVAGGGWHSLALLVNGQLR